MTKRLCAAKQIHVFGDLRKRSPSAKSKTGLATFSNWKEAKREGTREDSVKKTPNRPLKNDLMRSGRGDISQREKTTSRRKEIRTHMQEGTARIKLTGSNLAQSVLMPPGGNRAVQSRTESAALEQRGGRAKASVYGTTLTQI